MTLAFPRRPASRRLAGGLIDRETSLNVGPVEAAMKISIPKPAPSVEFGGFRARRRAFLFGAASSALYGALLKSGSAAPSMKSGAHAEEATKDPFEGDFPPAVYGRTLEETEVTIQDVVEKVFRDSDGMLLSGVNGATMKPLRAEDVKDRPQGVGTFAENSAIPHALRAVWTNYENAGQSSGTYLEALCAKARHSSDGPARELARRTVDAIVTLWNNAAATQDALGGGGRGWFPKPYDGIQRIAQMHECSADQYCDVTLGLHTYYLTLADAEEKRKIEEVIVSFADWWHDHDYCGIYFGQAIWWKRLKTHSMAVSYFLYLNALAQSWRPSPKFERGFEIWWNLRSALRPPDKAGWVCMHGITLNCLERLMVLRPDLKDEWGRAAAHQALLLAASVGAASKPWNEYNTESYGADYLNTAHRLLPKEGYDHLSRGCLGACMRRENFYHVRRGQRLAELNTKLTGDDYRNIFMSEQHVHWLKGYWQSRPG